MVKLSEDLLIDAAGWQVMKEARAIHAAGRVLSAKFEPPTLLGQVKGETEYRAGLKILSKTDIENLCGCPTSRRRSQICAHSVAVGLAVLKPLASPTSAKLPPAKEKAAFPFQLASDMPEVELHVILPPNVEQAWQRDSLMIVVEAAVGGQRKPLASLPPKPSYRCDFYDLQFARAFLALTDGKFASMAQLTKAQFSGLLESLTSHPRITCGKTQEMAVSEEALRPVLRATLGKDGTVTLTTKLPPTLLRSPAGFWHLANNTLRRVTPGLPMAYSMVFDTPVPLPPAALPGFVKTELPLLASYFALEGEENFPALEDLPPPEPPPPLKLSIEGSLNALTATFDGRSDAATMARYGFAERKGEFLLKGEREILTFFATGLPQLQKDWQVTVGERFQHVTRNVERIAPRLKVKGSGEQWFDLSVDMQTASGERYTANDLTRLINSGQNYVKRPNGRVTVFDPHLLDDFSQLLKEAAPDQRSPSVFRLENRQSASIASFVADHALALQAPPAWQGKPQELRPVPLLELEEVMRPYQKHGVYWLNYLAGNRFGGILADEMGLGKTIQMLAFLRSLKTNGPSLIVCPASLIFNWVNEAKKWVPGLSLLVLEGPQRAKAFAQIPQAQLVLTSYPLLRQDAEFHRTQAYEAVLLDEAQQIKNPESQLAQAAYALRAKWKFALTGTPVENSVRDLWSLFNFVMPGYLGTQKEFKERYESSQQDAGTQKRLSRRVAPFILRRTKNVVAKDLPAKLEQVLWCEMSPAQSEIYHQLAATTRQQLANLSGSKEQKKYRIVMLTALLRLRQAACDARLLGLENPPDDADASGKLDHFMETIEEAQEGGHRVLVFSQFVTMLAHIRSRLDAQGSRYCYLDGQSKDRAEQVQKFQTEGTPLFLISLKAGGTGLNLTAADVVIHFDPWWNPAVEAQATDRAHRIGQKKVVTSYKLITRGTVEEKILTLQEKKKNLIAATLESEQPMMEGLSASEIEDLLS